MKYYENHSFGNSGHFNWADYLPGDGGDKISLWGTRHHRSIAGSNEFSPGQETVFTVNIENKGLIDIKFVQSGIVERDDLPNTAKLVRATLLPGMPRYW